MKVRNVVVMGALAGCLSMATTVSATIIQNGSFETGDFTGWVTQDLADPFTPLAVTPEGLPGFFFVTSPTDGEFAATHGFDGSIGTIRMGQDIFITPGQAVIQFDYRASWEIWGFEARLLNVTVEVAGGGVQLASYNILTAAAGTFNFDTGILVGKADLSPFAGQLVRVSIDAVIPENFSGPAQMQIDNVVAIPEPSSVAMIGLVSGCAVFIRKRFMI